MIVSELTRNGLWMRKYLPSDRTTLKKFRSWMNLSKDYLRGRNLPSIPLRVWSWAKCSSQNGDDANARTKT